MPRLSHPKILKGQAIAALIEQYRNDKDFARELDKICDPYLDMIIQFARSSYEAGKGSKLQNMKDWTNEYKTLETEELERIKSELQPYCKALYKLAYKWKLTASWVAPMLILYDVVDVLKIDGQLPIETTIPVELYEKFCLFEAPLPAMEFCIPAWAITLMIKSST